MAPKATIELRGLAAFQKTLIGLSDFQRLARKPLAAGLGAAKDVMVAEVPSRKAKRAIKVRIYRDTSTGLTGAVGPVGGAQRPGYLAALFLEKGTGIHGPKHRAITPRRGQAFAFFSQQATTAGFGPSAQLFTKSGRLRKAAFNRFGNAGQVVVRSTRGAPARPWFDRSVSRARPRASEAFSQKLHEQVVGIVAAAGR
jgi:hypothetical protein